MRANGHKLNDRMLHLYMIEHFFTVRATKQWCRLSRVVLESPAYGIFKSYLDMIQTTLGSPA